jgi:5-methylcytosine-specific restriction endonuclease McrA
MVSESYAHGRSLPTQVTPTLDAEAMALLERFKNLSAHRNPKGEISKAIKLALELAIKKIDPTKEKSPRKPSKKTIPTSNVKGRKYISKDLRREVWRKSQGKCQFENPRTGKKCESQFASQIDHVLPVVLGGRNELSNLRLLCKNHNLNLGRQLLAKLRNQPNSVPKNRIDEPKF